MYLLCACMLEEGHMFATAHVKVRGKLCRADSLSTIMWFQNWTCKARPFRTVLHPHGHLSPQGEVS